MKECLSYALRILTKKDYSIFKMREKLIARGHSEEVVEEVIANLKEQNYLNDERYKDSFLRYYARKKKGPYYILQKCEDKGISSSTEEVEQTYQELEISMEETISTHIQNKIFKDRINLENLSYEAKMKIIFKIKSYLMNKGFKVNNIDQYITFK